MKDCSFTSLTSNVSVWVMISSVTLFVDVRVMSYSSPASKSPESDHLK
jgi:hypothetical protein